METFRHPLTGEEIKLTITTLGAAKQELSDIANKTKEALEKVNDMLMDLLLKEPDEKYESDDLIFKVQRSSRKEFDLNKVFSLLGDVRQYVDEKGATVNLYEPKATAINEYLAYRLKQGELTQEQANAYKESFVQRPIKPSIRITAK